MKTGLYTRSAELYFKGMWLLTIALYIMIPLEYGFLKVVYDGIHLITIVVSLVITAVPLLRGEIDVFNMKRIGLLLGLGVVLVFSVMLSAEVVSFDVQGVGILGFLEMLFAIYIVDRVDHGEDKITFVFRVNLVIALIFSVLSLTSLAYTHELENSLNLGFSNPNATAIYLLLNFSLLLLYTFRVKKQLNRILVYVLCVYLFLMIYRTNCRTGVVAAIAVAAYILIAPKWKIPKFWIFAAMLLPFVVLFVYTGLYEDGRFQDLTILGKPFYSGREEYFAEMLEELKGYWLVGDVGKNFFNNMHNGPLSILSSCGVIGYLLYLRFMGITTRHYYRGAVSHIQTVALVVIFSVFFHSSSEAALVVGGSHYSIVLATFFWLLKGQDAESGGLDGR